jgi:hypothetical protein
MQETSVPRMHHVTGVPEIDNKTRHLKIICADIFPSSVVMLGMIPIILNRSDLTCSSDFQYLSGLLLKVPQIKYGVQFSYLSLIALYEFQLSYYL